jgi:hypothetical protein
MPQQMKAQAGWATLRRVPKREMLLPASITHAESAIRSARLQIDRAREMLRFSQELIRGSGASQSAAIWSIRLRADNLN